MNKDSYSNKTFLGSINHNKGLLLLLIIFSLFFFVWNSWGYDVFWFDESFSINLIKKTYLEIIDITSRDVHPPLYYLMLKVYCNIFGYDISTIRFFSLLPIIILLFVGSFALHKRFGQTASIYFILLLTFMPVMLYVTSEIRMYSWAMLWTSLAFIYAYDVYKSFNKTNLLLLLITSLAGAYTHNYALIAIFYIYVVLFFTFLVFKRNVLFKFFSFCLLFIVFYLPWLLQLLGQFNTINGDYWIKDIVLDDIVGYILYPIDIIYPYIENPRCLKTAKPILFILLFVSCFIVLYRILSQWRAVKSDNILIAHFAILIYILPCITGVIVSLIVQPVFISRYLIPSLGILFIGISLYLSRLDLKSIFNRILVGCFWCIFISLSLINVSLNKSSIGNKVLVQKTFVDYVNKHLNDRSAFLYSAHLYFPLGVYSIYFADNKHFVYFDSQPLTSVEKITFENIDHIKIENYSEIDSIYDQIFILDNFDGLSNPMYYPNDSIEISKLFEVEDEITAGYYNYHLYRLKKKKY